MAEAMAATDEHRDSAEQPSTMDEEVNLPQQVPDLSTAAYIRYPCVFELDDLQQPVRTGRRIRNEHKDKLRHSLNTVGYLPSQDNMSVTVKDDFTLLTDIVTEIQAGHEGRAQGGERRVFKLKVAGVVVDGAHRLEVYREPRFREIIDCTTLRGTLWLRKKEGRAGQKLSSLDIVHLGALLNEPNTATKAMSTADRIHHVVATAVEIGNLIPNPTVLTKGMLMTALGLSSTESKTTRWRLARIGFRAYKRPHVAQGLEQLCDNYRILKVSYIGSDKILALCDEALLVVVEGMAMWLTASQKKNGRRTTGLPLFYKDMVTLFEYINKLVSDNNITMPQFLDLPVIRAPVRSEGEENTIRAVVLQGIGNLDNYGASSTNASRLRDLTINVKDVADTFTVRVSRGKEKIPCTKPRAKQRSRPRDYEVSKASYTRKKPKRAIPQHENAAPYPPSSPLTLPPTPSAPHHQHCSGLEAIRNKRIRGVQVPSHPIYTDGDCAPLEGPPPLLLQHTSLAPTLQDLGLDSERTEEAAVAHLTRPPSQWLRNGPSAIPSTEAVLQRLGFPEGHRAYWYATRTIVHEQAWLVNCTLLEASTQEPGMEYNDREDAVHTSTTAPIDNDFIQRFKAASHSFADRVKAQTQLDYFTDEQVGRLRYALREEGYTIIPGLLNDTGKLQTGGSTKEQMQCEEWPFSGDVMNLFDVAQDSIPNKAQHTSRNKRPTRWVFIRNRSMEQDKVDWKRSRGRRMERRENIKGMEEGDVTFMTAAHSRVILEIRILLLLCRLRLLGVWKEPEEGLVVPITGGRFLSTTPGCRSQWPHVDAPFESESTRTPGYTAIATGEQGARLWVCSGSHHVIRGSTEALTAYCDREEAVRLVNIPAYSLFLMRADLIHAGAAARNEGGKALAELRYHLPITRRGTEHKGLELMKDPVLSSLVAKMDKDS